MEEYVAAFVARCDAVRGAEARMVDAAGIHGLLSLSGVSPSRLLVTDDRAADVLAALVPDVAAGTISVVAAAPRCTEMLRGRPGWTWSAVTAMLHRDLGAIPTLTLPSGLALRPICRTADDPTTGVPLEDAVALALAGESRGADVARELTDHLRAMSGVRLFAAVDAAGAVCATSGYGTFGAYALVVFVNTHPDWRRRGVGRAMTATALHAARAAGATAASLEASDTAITTYERLGFEIVARATQFFCAPRPG